MGHFARLLTLHFWGYRLGSYSHKAPEVFFIMYFSLEIIVLEQWCKLMACGPIAANIHLACSLKMLS